MASIENRSLVQVSVKNRDDLTKTFEYCADKAIAAYVGQLKAQGYKPKLASLNNHYAIRARRRLGAGVRTRLAGQLTPGRLALCSQT